MRFIIYKAGYKYQLTETYRHPCPPGLDCPDFFTRYFAIRDSVLTVYQGYAWDGPSGPTIDTETFMRGSLVHDVIYQAMREEFISPELKDVADRELRRICIEDGMPKLRAWWVYQGVRFGGASHLRPGSGRKVRLAGIDAHTGTPKRRSETAGKAIEGQGTASH